MKTMLKYKLEKTGSDQILFQVLYMHESLRSCALEGASIFQCISKHDNTVVFYSISKPELSFIRTDKHIEVYLRGSLKEKDFNAFLINLASEKERDTIYQEIQDAFVSFKNFLNGKKNDGVFIKEPYPDFYHFYNKVGEKVLTCLIQQQGKEVYFKVFAMDERFRYSKVGDHVCSNNYPELFDTTIYLRGENLKNDNYINYLNWNSIQKAKEVKEQALNSLKNWAENWDWESKEVNIKCFKEVEKNIFEIRAKH